MSRFTNDYTPDWKEVQAAAMERAGHRCIRCGHPYRKGEHGKGELSPCDVKCTHATGEKGAVHWVDGKWQAHWRIMTTHHFDGDKANNAWWNLLCLCQRCHLTVQGKVIPDIPYFLTHSKWIQPYVAGFYAKKYLGLDLNREETMARLDELLALECRISGNSAGSTKEQNAN